MLNKLFKHPKKIEILIHLSKQYQPRTFVELSKDLGEGYGSIMLLAKELQELNLVKKNGRIKGEQLSTLEITENGKIIAEKFEELNKLINEIC